jgi:hypothetical protein
MYNKKASTAFSPMNQRRAEFFATLHGISGLFYFKEILGEGSLSDLQNPMLDWLATNIIPSSACQQLWSFLF